MRGGAEPVHIVRRNPKEDAMAPDKRKGREPARGAAEDELEAAKKRSARQPEEDPREEEGYAQPESSAQRGPTRSEE